MGVVYEAEQLSLRRRVALKVLPFAATMDPRHLQRFHNEAQAAAGLHHSNIVPVYFVGCERGVHFYAMQFIDGQTLARVIAELRSQSADATKGAETARAPLAPPTGAATDSTEPYLPQPDRPPAVAYTAPKAGLSTEGSAHGRAFIRMAAQLGVQAAEALEHAHQLGIVHRDIKPANLLVDGRGNLWVTDFGLAHCQGQPGLTMSGDLLGTLRYMSPEQALAQRVDIDPRTDVYSLGATLYELLTLEPAFGGQDRQELLRQIAFEDPRPPRRLNKAIPPELETIVLTAMEKNPADRYAAAQDLADDLRRFLDDKPIRARRPTLWHRAKKWGRRNRSVVWTASIVSLLALAVLAGCIGWMIRDRAVRQAARAAQAEAAFQEATRFQEQGNWSEALSAAKRAEGFLEGGASPELESRVRELRRDLEMVIRLEDIRLESSAGRHGSYDFEGRGPAYAAAFREYGIDVTVLEPPEAAERLRAKGQGIRDELLAALDDWAFMAYGPTPQRTRLLAISRAADSDDWRNQLRDALERGDRKVLKQLADSEQVLHLPASSLKLFGDYLLKAGALEEGVALLLKAQWQHVANFWINESLGSWLKFTDPPQTDESIRFCQAALALRPKSAEVYCALGDSLLQKGLSSQAEAVYRQVIKVRPDYWGGHYRLIATLAEQGKDVEAREVLVKASQVITRPALNLNNWAWNIVVEFPERDRRCVPLAVEAAEKAVELAPDADYVRNTLGAIYYRAGNHKEAIEVLEKSMEVRHGGDSFDWIFLAMAHQKLGHGKEARQWYDRSVQWMDKNAAIPQHHPLRRFRAEAEEVLGVHPKDRKDTRKKASH
jgi:serine/threonine protein kinase/Tfp pilus assembly protein PilF